MDDKASLKGAWLGHVKVLHLGRISQIVLGWHILPPNGRGQGHVSRFFNFAPIINLIGEAMPAMRFKFRVLFDTEEYQCMLDRLSPKGLCSGSHLQFGK